jgi:hypothetical protein
MNFGVTKIAAALAAGCCLLCWLLPAAECSVSARVSRVARWYVFKPKIQIWLNFGGSCKG